jgi:hypothetical protein
VDPDINEAMTFKLGQGKENHFPGIFGNLTDGFGHHDPPAHCLDRQLDWGLTLPKFPTLSTPFAYATL